MTIDRERDLVTFTSSFLRRELSFPVQDQKFPVLTIYLDQERRFVHAVIKQQILKLSAFKFTEDQFFSIFASGCLLEAFFFHAYKSAILASKLRRGGGGGGHLLQHGIFTVYNYLV